MPIKRSAQVHIRECRSFEKCHRLPPACGSWKPATTPSCNPARLASNCSKKFLRFQDTTCASHNTLDCRETGPSDKAAEMRNLKAAQFTVRSQTSLVVRIGRSILHASLRSQPASTMSSVKQKKPFFLRACNLFPGVASLTPPPQSKLARARDETMRLLKVHLSRARRLVFAGLLNTASRAR